MTFGLWRPERVTGDNSCMKSSDGFLRPGFVAGVVTWAVVSGIALYLGGTSPSTGTGVLIPAALLALVNLAAMIVAGRAGGPGSRTSVVALWIHLASSFGLGLLLPFGFVTIYTIIWIAMAASFYPARVCLALMAGILIGWYLITSLVRDEQGALLSVALYGTFHLFALFSARSTIEAEAARDQVRALNRELMATQHLLSEASRQNERTRIARDLHDLLGHHLTALSLNLQIAERLSSGDAEDKISEARAIARLLLADVREAVSTLREEGDLDLKSALTLLAQNVPELDVHLDIDDDLAISDVEVAESLLRCAQEAITNTLRHSGAARMWIRIWQEGDRLHLDVRDDGRVQGELVEGNGLSGMRERLKRIDGSIALDTGEGGGLRLTVALPAT